MFLLLLLRICCRCCCQYCRWCATVVSGCVALMILSLVDWRLCWLAWSRGIVVWVAGEFVVACRSSRLDNRREPLMRCCSNPFSFCRRKLIPSPPWEVYFTPPDGVLRRRSCALNYGFEVVVREHNLLAMLIRKYLRIQLKRDHWDNK